MQQSGSHSQVCGEHICDGCSKYRECWLAGSAAIVFQYTYRIVVNSQFCKFGIGGIRNL